MDGAVLTALFLVIAGLVFAALFVTLPGNQHFYALLAIGIVALFFSLGSYLAEALSRNPTAERSLAWGFFGIGIAVLLLAVDSDHRTTSSARCGGSGAS